MPREGRTGWSEPAELAVLAGLAELEDDDAAAPTLSAKSAERMGHPLE